MNKRLHSIRCMLVVGAFVFVAGWPAALAQNLSQADANAKSPAQAQANQEPQKFTRSSDASLYVGSEVCKTCHEDMPSKGFYQHYEFSPHFVTTQEKKRGPEWHGCEACHGPGKAHVDAGGDKTKIFTFKNASAKEIVSLCMDCHAGGREHMNALNSIHTRNGVSCIACHSPHYAETKEYLLAKPQTELCYTCHTARRAEFQMPFHHRVEEGLIQCTDCHNVHGTERPHQVRTSATEDVICVKCHMEVQGPFVYEHAPVKVDGCTACHMVHGGPNAHMLKISNVNLLCLQCHTTSSFSSAPGAPSFHNQATFFQACTLCHISIHGSNFSPTFFR
jgi:DmsE family decaheme c-type cytochrome